MEPIPERPPMATLIRGLRFFYLLWGAMLLGTLAVNNRIRLPEPLWHWTWLPRFLYSPVGRGLLLGIAAAMCLGALAEVWELADRLLSRFFHDSERDH
jgi:hypothetical protein